jgi:predicted transcriptional regulator
MADNNKKTVDELISELTDKGGVKADKKLSEIAMSTDRDVTDVDSEDLGDFIKQTVNNGYSCVVYAAATRIMLSIYG